MLVGETPPAELARRLRGDGLHLDTGAFVTRLRIELPHLVGEFARMYADYPLGEAPAIDDFEVRVGSPSLLRRFVRPQAQSWIDGVDIMEPLPLDQAYPGLESSLNLAVATGNYIPLVVHSAVLERDGRALVMPAPSGSGKSTLCAALAWRGWRLLSDEMTVFCFDTGNVLPNPRPVSLKNRGVEVIAAFEPRACFSRVYRGTNKGDVAYMRPPPEAVARAHEPARPGMVVAPVFREGAPTSVHEMDRTAAFRWLVDNSVNYPSMLQTGFDLLTGFIERCALYSLTYSNLDEAIEQIGRLHRQLPPLAPD
jgi:HprK-related kinase A